MVLRVIPMGLPVLLPAVKGVVFLFFFFHKRSASSSFGLSLGSILWIVIILNSDRFLKGTYFLRSPKNLSFFDLKTFISLSF